MTSKAKTISHIALWACVSTLAFWQIRDTLPGGADAHTSPNVKEHVLGSAAEFAELREQGELSLTERPLDAAIDGPGYFQIVDLTHAEIRYTRYGRFQFTSDGCLAISAGNQVFDVEPVITVPRDATQFNVSTEGIISVRRPGNPDLIRLGQLQIARFANPSGLKTSGNLIFAASNDSGVPFIGNPGKDGFGVLRQGYLEELAMEPVVVALTNHLTGTLK